MTGAVVRVAAGAQVADAGALTAEAYLADRLVDAAESYTDELRDAERRAREATLLVALLPPGEGDASNERGADDDDLVVVGTVTLAPYGTSYAEVAEPGELEIRMLAVAPEARRRGIAELLMSAALREAVASGATRVVLSTLDSMAGRAAPVRAARLRGGAGTRLGSRRGAPAGAHVDPAGRARCAGRGRDVAAGPGGRRGRLAGRALGRADPPREQRAAARHPAGRHGDARPGGGALRRGGAAVDRAGVPRGAARSGRPARAARLRGHVPHRRAGARARRARARARRGADGRRTGAGVGRRPTRTTSGSRRGPARRRGCTPPAPRRRPTRRACGWPAACSAERPPSTSRRRMPRDWSGSCAPRSRRTGSRCRASSSRRLPAGAGSGGS